MSEIPNTPKPAECESCGFEGANLKAYRNMSATGLNPSTKDTHKWLCELCASTMAGSMHEYPRLYSEAERNIIAAVCHVGNAVLAAQKPISRHELSAILLELPAEGQFPYMQDRLRNLGIEVED